MKTYKIVTSTITLNNMLAVVQRLEDVINQAERVHHLSLEQGNEQAAKNAASIVKNTLECLELLNVQVNVKE